MTKVFAQTFSKCALIVLSDLSSYYNYSIKAFLKETTELQKLKD